MWYLDDWHDAFRALSFLLCASSFVYLLKVRITRPVVQIWSIKTLDLWLAMLMWTLTGMAFAIEALFEDRPAEPRLIFYLIASIFTALGVFKKGDWGEKRS